MVIPAGKTALAASLVLMVSGSRQLNAQELGGRIRIAGFGGVWYGKTDGYSFLGGEKKGSFNNNNLAVLLSGVVSDRLTVSSLIDWNQISADQEMRVDYA